MGERHVVVDRQLFDRLLGLERAPHAPLGATEVGDLEQVVTERGHAPGGRLDKPAEHVEEGRLARAVRPDQATGAVLEPDGHRIKWRDAAEADGEVGDLDHKPSPDRSDSGAATAAVGSPPGAARADAGASSEPSPASAG